MRRTVLLFLLGSFFRFTGAIGASLPTCSPCLPPPADTIGPTIVCPNDVTVSLSETGCEGLADLPDAVLNTDCGFVTGIAAVWQHEGLPYILNGTLADFPGNDPSNPDTLGVLGLAPDFPVGERQMQYWVSDVCGNVAGCTFNLTVWDVTPPVAACEPWHEVFLSELAIGVLPAEIFNNGSTADSCNTLSYRAKRALFSSCSATDQWQELVEFCCADIGDTVLVTLRVYDEALPDGPVTEDFADGHFDECQVQVVVFDTHGPACIAPPDTTVFCSELDPTGAAYGDPILTCAADSFAVSLDFSQFDLVCQRGTIARTFITLANGTVGGQCEQLITVDYEQDYFVRFPDDVIVATCDNGGNFGEPQLFGLDCENMAIGFTDELFEVVPDACYKIERTWTILNRCAYDSLQAFVSVPNPNPNAMGNHPDNLPGPVVSAPGTTGPWAPTVSKINPDDPQPADFSSFWSLQTNGYHYVQTIKILDTQGPLVADCPTTTAASDDTTANDPLFWNEPYWWNPYANSNDLCEGPAGLSITATDACSGADVTIEYELFLDLDDTDGQESVVSSTNFPGVNTIFYNNAGNPNYAGGTPRAFDERPLPFNQKWRFNIDRVRSGDSLTAYVRWDAIAQNTITQLPADNILQGVAPQLPHGTHKIRWIITDECGNPATCEYFFQVSGGVGACLPPETPLGGAITTETGAGVKDVEVKMTGTAPLPAYTYFAETNPQGVYAFVENVPAGASFSLKPARNDNPMNGISTFDLVLMSKHILGITPLNSPYKIIAADINRSNSVTTFDIVELRKLILGIYSDFPANTAWRFVPGDFIFDDPANPFVPVFPEQISVNNLPPNDTTAYDFIGIKTGDLSGDAVPNTQAGADDRSAGTLWLHAGDDRIVQSGEVFDLTIKTDEMGLLGCQFTLEHPQLELLALTPLSTTLGPDNFAVFASALTCSWHGDAPPVFQLRFRATTTGPLHDLLRISDRITRSEAYFLSDSYGMTNGMTPNDPMTSNDPTTQWKVALRFNNSTAQGNTSGLILQQNVPNPFSDRTLITFVLPEETSAALRVFDLTGRVVWAKETVWAAGEHRIWLDRAALGADGVFYFEIKTPTERAVKKLVVWRRE